LHRGIDGGIDLVLHGAVACPTRCHGNLRKSQFD
jgi:hypothetical protein